jgi:hypothetical protein
VGRARRYDRRVDQLAARHSEHAFALRELEKTLNSAGWASLYTDYRNQVSQGKLTSVSAKVETSPLTNRLFKDSENVAKQRRKLMKVTLIPDPDDAPELTPEIARRSQISVGGKVVREATGTMTKDKTS